MKTTKKHFEIFKLECLWWQKKLELNNWKIYFYHESIGRSVFGTIDSNIEGYVARIILNTEVPDGTTNEQIEETAKHEMIHLLLSRLSEYAKGRSYTIADIYEAEEELVRKIDYLLK